MLVIVILLVLPQLTFGLLKLTLIRLLNLAIRSLYIAFLNSTQDE